MPKKDKHDLKKTPVQEVEPELDELEAVREGIANSGRKSMSNGAS